MASAATLRLLLERALERERSGILRRGSGVRRSHVVRQIGERLFRRRWLTTHEQRLGLDTPLGSADLREAIRVVRAIGPLLLEATAACAEVVDLVADALHAQGLTTTPAELSSPVASAVGSYAVGRGARPGAKDVRMLASKVVDRILAAQARRQWATGGHTLTPTEAIARYDTMDDHCWERLGHASNEIFPPDGVLLGPNRRTPLVAGGGRPNWQVGTGRSIYERYRLRWISDTKIDCKHLKRVPVASAADPFAQEVVRACHPYGLRGRSYQEIVEALYVGGARPDDGRGSTRGRDAFRAACSECRVVPARDELTQAVTGLLDFWWWISVGGAMVRSHPNSTVVPVQQIQRAIVRKAWMTLLAWDRVSAAPVRTCQFVRAARIAVECGIAPALQALRDGQADPDDLLGGTGEMALVGDAPTLSLDWSETVSRRQQTMELLAGDKDTAAAIGARAPEWERAYLRLVAGCGRSLEEFLSPAELVEYLDEMGF